MSICKEKIQFFERTLLDFFRKAGREHLPWRRSEITAYEVWVSEIMLQQTQVVRVIEYYKNFLKRFPTVELLAQASWEEFLPYYQGLGYYVRGRNMLLTAQMVVKEYGGAFPRDKKLLQALPGIGPYTAAAISSFAYDENRLAWDTNLRRVIGRFFLGGKHRIVDESVWEEKFITPKKEMNAALMDFGSALCVARPKCEACALRTRCVYYQEKGRQEVSLKQRESRIKNQESEINWQEAEAYVFLHENHRKYFSAIKKSYQPFMLPARYNTRAGIKKYFLEKYALTLSVRPPHRKLFLVKKPILLVNAQILLGKPEFVVFSKNALAEYNKSTFSSKFTKKLISYSLCN